MMWAAATLGIYGILRPNEMLSRHHESNIRVEDIEFYATAGKERLVDLLSPGLLLDEHKWPDRYTINLHITKTDQTGKRPPKVIAAKTAVRAMWTWLNLRQAFGFHHDFVFCQKEGKLLTMKRLMENIQTGLTSLGYHDVHITPKCFRRGGASALVQQGLANSDVALVGGWQSANMVNTYASAAAQQARTIAISRRMDPRRM
jgi:integrase